MDQLEVSIVIEDQSDVSIGTLHQSQLVPHRVDLGAPGVGADPVELPRRALADSRAQQLPAQGASIVSDLAEAGAIQQELCLWLSSLYLQFITLFCLHPRRE